MKFIKLLRFDLKNGILKNKMVYLSAIIIAAAFCIDFSNTIRIRNLTGTKTVASFADYLMYIYGGMKEYIPSPFNSFIFPIVWILLFILLFFVTLNYPDQDLQCAGQQILIRTKGRTLWWLSKCGWNIICSCVYNFLIFLTVFLFCLLTHTDTSTDIHTALFLDVFRLRGEINLVSTDILLPFSIFLLPVLISISINLFQMMLSLFIKPLFSFLVIAVLMVSSAYLLSPFMLGNYAMPIRSNLVLRNGVSAQIGLLLALLLIALSIIIGIVRFHYYDILNRD